MKHSLLLIFIAIAFMAASCDEKPKGWKDPRTTLCESEGCIVLDKECHYEYNELIYDFTLRDQEGGLAKASTYEWYYKKYNLGDTIKNECTGISKPIPKQIN